MDVSPAHVELRKKRSEWGGGWGRTKEASQEPINCKEKGNGVAGTLVICTCGRKCHIHEWIGWNREWRRLWGRC